MQKLGLQVYGLPSHENQIKQVLGKCEISHLELNIIDQADLEKFKTLLTSHEKVSSLGVHVNLKYLEEMGATGLGFIQKAGNRLIVPTAVEENTLIWPLSFFRRFPRIYSRLRGLIDFFRKNGLRRKVGGSGVDNKSYFDEAFWVSLAKKMNSLSRAGFEVGYHNHGIEFEGSINGKMPIEILDEYLEDDIFFQLDLTNLIMSGHYSLNLIEKMSNRIKSIHLRIEGVGTEVFYEDLVHSKKNIFRNRDLIIELKEKSESDMIKRTKWWKDLLANNLLK